MKCVGLTLWPFAIAFQKTGAKSEVLDFLDAKFQRAKSLGYGEEDVAALMKVFRE